MFILEPEVCKADTATNVGGKILSLSVGIVNINYTRWLLFWLSSTNQTWLHHNDGNFHYVYRNYEIYTFWLATNLTL